MRSSLLTLIFVLMAIVGFAQPRWYNSYSQIESTEEIRSTVIALENAQSILIAAGNLAMLDINGENLWQKKPVGTSRFYDGLQMDDGTVVVVGYSKVGGPDGNLNALTLTAMNSAGDVQWTTSLSAEARHLSGLCVSVESNANLLVGGYLSDQGDGSGNLQGLLARFSNEGELMSSVALPEGMAVQDIALDGAGGGIAVGCLGQGSAGDLTGGVFSYFGFDADFNPTWWHSIDGMDGCASGVENFGTNFAIGGTIEQNLIMLEVDGSGAILDNGIMDAVDDVYMHSMGLTTDGDMLIGLDILRNTNGGGTQFLQPLGVLMSEFSSWDMAIQFDNGFENDRFISGIAGMVDGSILVGCQEVGGKGAYKLFPGEPLPSCAFGQPQVTLIDDPISLISNTPVPEISPLILSNEITPILSNMSSVKTEHCGGTYCETEVEISSPNPVQCANSQFDFVSSLEGDISYQWGFEGESVGTADTLALDINEWGFFEITLSILDENFCASDDVFSITALPTPDPILTVADSVVLCQGETVVLGLTEEFSFHTWNNLSNQPLITVGFEGEYYVTVIGENGCVSTSDTTTVYVGEYPEPTVELTGETPFCANQSVTMSTQLFASYEWILGQDIQSFETFMPGPYSVTVTSALGCIGISDTLWLDTLAVPTPAVLVDGPLSWCMSDALSLGLGANGTYDNVLWSNFVNDSSISVTNAGSFSYTATSFDGCSAFSDTVIVTTWVNPEITVENILETAGSQCNGLIDISVVTESPSFDLAWTGFPDETELTLSDLCYGNYTVTIVDEYGCSATETFFVDTYIGLEELQSEVITGFPNPVQNELNFTPENSFLEYRVIDNQGVLVKTKKFSNNIIDCSGLTPGVYNVQLFDGNNWTQSRFVKL